MDKPCDCDLCKRSKFITKCCDRLRFHSKFDLAQGLEDVYNDIMDQEEESDMQIADLQDQVKKLKVLTKSQEDALKEAQDVIKGLQQDVSNLKEDKKELQKRIDVQFAELQSVDRRELDNKGLEKENQRLKVALDNADKKVAELQAKQPHPGDVKMGAIIKKAFQDLQAAELEKNLVLPRDYSLPKNNWY